MPDVKKAMNYTHLFGPVQSRRLGVSLGVDMVTAKTCSLDCAYCECGRTEVLTLERKEYVPANELIAELTDYLKTGPSLDYITFGGSGEPTLNTGLGRVIRFLKKDFPEYRCALLTNGTLFFLPAVRKECMKFDVVLPNLDAVSRAVFKKINRPHRELDNEKIIKGLSAFRDEYKGMIWLEIFIVPGINDTPEELDKIIESARTINPDRVQLNTLDRPGVCDWVKPASVERLTTIAGFFSPLPVQIISREKTSSSLWESSGVNQDTIRSLIARRPSTADEISRMAGLTINQTVAMLSALIATRAVIPYSVGTRTFYRISNL
jgi:wyosine [tRNA(Phe)-imidazoG37] synthetase (radical SAM superfamily)